MIHVNEDNFEVEVLDCKNIVIIDFWASWCQPCLMMGPVFEEVSKGFPKEKFVKINVDDCPNIASEFSIDGIPCIVLIKAGEEIGRLIGYKTLPVLKKEIESVINPVN